MCLTCQRVTDPAPAAPYVKPWSDALGGFLGWVSLQPHDWLDLHAATHAHMYYSPIRALVLFGRYSGIDRALEILELDRPVAVREVVAQRPIHEGFIAMLELERGGTEDVRATVNAFAERERRRDVEAWLRGCYGKADGIEHDIRFYGMDYPTFDNGSVDPEFGLMIDRDHLQWVWSRAVFHHK